MSSLAGFRSCWSSWRVGGAGLVGFRGGSLCAVGGKPRYDARHLVSLLVSGLAATPPP